MAQQRFTPQELQELTLGQALAFKAQRGGIFFNTYLGDSPSISHSLGPSHLYNLIAQRVNTPNPPKVPENPRTIPRIDGPGPSAENQPHPDPALQSDYFSCW